MYFFVLSGTQENLEVIKNRFFGRRVCKEAKKVEDEGGKRSRQEKEFHLPMGTCFNYKDFMPGNQNFTHHHRYHIRQ